MCYMNGNVQYSLLLFRSRTDEARALCEEKDKQIEELIDESQILQHEVGRLKEETSKQQRQLYYKQKAIDRLSSEREERQREMNRMREEKGELEQRVEEMDLLLKSAEAASEDAERRVRENEEVLNIAAEDMQLSDKEIGSGAFGCELPVFCLCVFLMRN